MLVEPPHSKWYLICHAILQHCIEVRAYSRATLEICLIHALPEGCYRKKTKKTNDRKWWEPFWVLLCIKHEPAVRFLCSWLQQRREVDESARQQPERDLRSSLCGYAALAAARGGADRTAHAQFGGGLGLRLGVGFRLGCVIVGGPGFGLSIAVSAGVIAPGLWLTLLLTPFQPGTDGETGHLLLFIYVFHCKGSY